MSELVEQRILRTMAEVLVETRQPTDNNIFDYVDAFSPSAKVHAKHIKTMLLQIARDREATLRAVCSWCNLVSGLLRGFLEINDATSRQQLTNGLENSYSILVKAQESLEKCQKHLTELHYHFSELMSVEGNIFSLTSDSYQSLVLEMKKVNPQLGEKANEVGLITAAVSGFLFYRLGFLFTGIASGVTYCALRTIAEMNEVLNEWKKNMAAIERMLKQVVENLTTDLNSVTKMKTNSDVIRCFLTLNDLPAKSMAKSANSLIQLCEKFIQEHPNY